MSLIDDLARIREAAGRSPLPDPTKIDGFGPGSAPVPPYIPRHDEPMNEPDEFGLDDDPPAAVVPPSPLVPRRPARLVQPEPATVPAGPAPDLIVCGTVAVWKGRQVELQPAEEKAVRATVLKALQRELDADLAAAGAKRTRKPRVKPEAILADPPKRGRPRKVKP